MRNRLLIITPLTLRPTTQCILHWCFTIHTLWECKGTLRTVQWISASGHFPAEMHPSPTATGPAPQQQSCASKSTWPQILPLVISWVLVPNSYASDASLLREYIEEAEHKDHTDSPAHERGWCEWYTNQTHLSFCRWPAGRAYSLCFRGRSLLHFFCLSPTAGGCLGTRSMPMFWGTPRCAISVQ